MPNKKETNKKQKGGEKPKSPCPLHSAYALTKHLIPPTHTKVAPQGVSTFNNTQVLSFAPFSWNLQSSRNPVWIHKTHLPSLLPGWLCRRWWESRAPLWPGWFWDEPPRRPSETGWFRHRGLEKKIIEAVTKQAVPGKPTEPEEPTSDWGDVKRLSLPNHLPNLISPTAFCYPSHLATRNAQSATMNLFLSAGLGVQSHTASLTSL